eukprot:gene7739-915_t
MSKEGDWEVRQAYREMDRQDAYAKQTGSTPEYQNTGVVEIGRDKARGAEDKEAPARGADNCVELDETIVLRHLGGYRLEPDEALVLRRLGGEVIS